MLMNKIERKWRRCILGGRKGRQLYFECIYLYQSQLCRFVLNIDGDLYRIKSPIWGDFYGFRSIIHCYCCILLFYLIPSDSLIPSNLVSSILYIRSKWARKPLRSNAKAPQTNNKRKLDFMRPTIWLSILGSNLNAFSGFVGWNECKVRGLTSQVNNIVGFNIVYTLHTLKLGLCVIYWYILYIFNVFSSLFSALCGSSCCV